MRAEVAPAASVAIASGDSDMQSLLSPSVSWLQLLPLATAACPLGVQPVTAADFQRQYQFPPAAYSDYLALTGWWRCSGLRCRLPPFASVHAWKDHALVVLGFQGSRMPALAEWGLGRRPGAF